MRFSEFTDTLDEIASSNKKKKVQLLGRLFRGRSEKTLETVAHLALGELVDPRYDAKLRIGSGSIRTALTKITNKSDEEIRDLHKESGDLSQVASNLAKGSGSLSVTDLWARVNRTVKRNESRAQLIRYVFENVDARGAKYFTRMALDTMRIGVGSGTLTKALAETFDVACEDVERVLALTNDVGLTAVRSRRGHRSLRQTGLVLFRAYRFMNAHRVADVNEAFDRLPDRSLMIETKYDGARLQIHVKTEDPLEIRIYSRRLDDVTASLPDVVQAIQNCWNGGDAILEAEAVAFDTSLSTKQPFRAVLSRLGRKQDVKQKAGETPLVLFVFDALFAEGRSLIDVRQEERREILKGLFHSTRRVQLTDLEQTGSRDDVRRLLESSVRSGHEGLIAKDPDDHYHPGERRYSWLKIKPEQESLDVVITGGVWGTGRRKGLLSSFDIAVRSDDDLLKVGKVGTGFSDDTLERLTEELEKNVIKTSGRHVEISPEVVIEVDFQEIQETDSHESGYALRIPRFLRERTDKSARQADALERLKRLYDAGNE